MHIDVNFTHCESSVFSEGPVNFIVRGSLENEVDGSICDVDMRCLHWDEIKCIKLTVNIHAEINSSNFDVDLVLLNVLENLSGETSGFNKMDAIKLKFVSSS